MMQTEIHGHDVLALVHQAPDPFTLDSLRAEALRRWGPEARFCTCAATHMTFEQLLMFLLSRGKLVQQDGRVYTDISRVCSGDGHAHSHGE